MNIRQDDSKLEPTNSSENIQDTIISEENTQNFLKILNPSHIKDAVEPFNNYIKYLYTGINSHITTNHNDDYYEIYLRMDLIEGEVTDDNKTNIKCVYIGEKLTDKLDTLLSFENYKKNEIELNPRRMYFVLDEMKGYSIVGRTFDDEEKKEHKKEKDKKEEDKKEEEKKEEEKKEEKMTNNYDVDPYFFRNMLERQGGGRRQSKSNKKNNNTTRKLKSYFMMN